MEKHRATKIIVATFTKKDILKQLDDCAKNFTFPMLDNGYIALADVRLTAYRDDTGWALVIEVLGAHNHAGGHDGIQNCLHCFGNCLSRAPGTSNEDFLFVTDDDQDIQIFEDKYGWYVNKNAKAIRIRDMCVPLNFSEPAFAKKGIQLEEPQYITTTELLRSLVPEYRESLLATEEELRERVPNNLPLILQLDEWHHPDLADGELPSQSRTFQMIADVLVTGDAAKYRPTEEPNTHWSNWPEGGTL